MAAHISSRGFVTELINSLSPPRTPDLSIDNPLATADDNDRKLLLTLHVIFPNELLPALDLLDRRLVTRICVRSTTYDKVVHLGGVSDDTNAVEPCNTFYQVRSAQQKTTSSRFHDPVPATYEVRLTSYHCSCPAFAFAAFPPSPDSEDNERTETSDTIIHSSADVFATKFGPDTAVPSGEASTWQFGGLTNDDGAAPACKHLLACVLVDRCPMFHGFLQERDMTTAEAAGWAAGWTG